jgi:hypothetical protein|tara:strand:+ start:3016 stop:3246 length:231 start_codon:yes stop_codon:yes gene_type:complete
MNIHSKIPINTIMNIHYINLFIILLSNYGLRDGLASRVVVTALALSMVTWCATDFERKYGLQPRQEERQQKKESGI